MVVSAISAFSGGYAYIQLDVEHEEIKKKLLALGLEATGSKTVDKARLSQAERELELENAQKTAAEQGQTTVGQTSEQTTAQKVAEDSELAYILRYLNVRQTDDVQIDYRNAITAFKTKFMTETNMAELSHLRMLKYNLDKIMAGYGYSVTSIAASEMTGASALGEMNKVMMLSGGSFNSSGK